MFTVFLCVDSQGSVRTFDIVEVHFFHTDLMTVNSCVYVICDVIRRD